MVCNEELFLERWYEKSTFPKQTLHMMSTLTKFDKNATMLLFIKVCHIPYFS